MPKKEVEKEIIEKELPVPNNKPDTITANRETSTPLNKSKRSAKQIEWSRELGRRSQEFKNKKLKRIQLTSHSSHDVSSHSAHEILTPPNSSKETGTSTPSYFYYLIPIGIIAGVYYFIKFKRSDNILLVPERPLPERSVPERSAPMKLVPEKSVPERSIKPNSLKLME